MSSACPCGGVALEKALSSVADPLTKESFVIVKCASCGLGKTEPQPDDLAPYYPVAYYGGRHGATAGFCLRRRLRWVGQEKCANAGMRECWNGGRLLDVGCGDGSFLLAARAEGWDVAGLERFPDDARAKGLEIFTDVSEVKTASVFDCITLWHSLEHIQDPFTLLGQLSALLKREGKLIVAVPDFGGWQARLFGRYWLHLDVPRHLWHFTLPAVRGAFKTAGLEVTRTYHQEFEYDMLGWSQSALNALFRKPNVFFNWLTKKPTGVSKPMLALHIVLGLGLTGLTLPLVWLGCACKRGGTVVVVGERHV